MQQVVRPSLESICSWLCKGKETRRGTDTDSVCLLLPPVKGVRRSTVHATARVDVLPLGVWAKSFDAGSERISMRCAILEEGAALGALPFSEVAFEWISVFTLQM